MVTVKLMLPAAVQALVLLKVGDDRVGLSGVCMSGSVICPLPAAILKRTADAGSPASKSEKNILFFSPQFALSGPSKEPEPE